jgi:hypothetical protein
MIIDCAPYPEPFGYCGYHDWCLLANLPCDARKLFYSILNELSIEHILEPKGAID